MPIKPPQNAPQHENKQAVSIWNQEIGMFIRRRPHRLPHKDLSFFCRKLAFLLGAGVPIKSALQIVAEQHPRGALGRVIPDIHTRVVQGQSLSAAIKTSEMFPSFFYGFCAIGEATAKLPEVMEQLADFYDGQAQTKDELVAALMYPAIVTAMMLGVVVLAVTFVLPGYSRIFAASGTELPMLTRGLLTVSGFMAVYGMWVLPGLLAVFILFIAFVRSTGGRGVVSRLLLFIPLYRHSINFLLAQSLYS